MSTLSIGTHGSCSAAVAEVSFLNLLTRSLVHVQLTRAYAMQGNTAKARAAYQDFLMLWKDADADIPILKQAKAEYAKLQ